MEDQKLIERQQKKELNKQKKQQKHLENLEKLKKMPYYDEKQDLLDIEAYYKDIKFSLQDPSQNYKQLNKLISSTYKHAKRRENIFSLIDRQPDYTLKCVYTLKTLEDVDGNQLMKCDEEHSVPQSYQAGTNKGCGKDMHQIFAAEKHANGSRGNKPFGPGQNFSLDQFEIIKEGEQKQEQKYFIKDTESGKFFTPIQKEGQNITTFVPKHNIGAIARSTLYILTCYDHSMDPQKFPKNLVQWLIQQAMEQPVSLWEKHRNQMLFSLQRNRNPFIDNPQWAEYIDFDQGFQQKKQ